jgi:hypothetical protein
MKGDLTKTRSLPAVGRVQRKNSLRLGGFARRKKSERGLMLFNCGLMTLREKKGGRAKAQRRKEMKGGLTKTRSLPAVGRVQRKISLRLGDFARKK